MTQKETAEIVLTALEREKLVILKDKEAKLTSAGQAFCKRLLMTFVSTNLSISSESPDFVKVYAEWEQKQLPKLGGYIGFALEYYAQFIGKNT